MTCIYDRATKTHLVDNDPCTHDKDGNPVHHCRARLRCTSHLGWDEEVCDRCIGRVKKGLDRVLALLALMPTVAIEVGSLDSRALDLAGPVANHVMASWSTINAERNGVIVEELDMGHPYTCLTMHERYIREHLGHDDTVLVSPTIGEAASYLAWALPDLARDEEGALLLSALLGDLGRLRAGLELVARLRQVPTRGAPCPECEKPPRLERRYAAWSTHDRFDTWHCPRDAEHVWTQEAYERYIETRRGKAKGVAS